MITKAQQSALKRLYKRQLNDDNPRFKSYVSLRRAVVPVFGCIMIDMGSIWLGIEPDGYTHS